jgi:hypothetical protein
MDRPDGHDWHEVAEVSFGQGERMDWTTGTDVSIVDSDGGMEGEGESEEEGVTQTRSRDISRGTMKGSGVTQSEQHGTSGGRTGPQSHMDHVEKSKHAGWSDASGTQYSDTQQESETERDGIADGESFKKGRKKSRGRNWSKSVNRGRKRGCGAGTTNQQSIAFRKVPLQRYRTEWYPAGLEREIQTQYAEFKRTLRNLDRREIMVISGNKPPVVARVHDLPDPFEELPAFGREWTRIFIEKNCRSKPYFFVPTECEKWVRKLPSPKPTNGSSNGATTPSRWSRYGFIVPKPRPNGSQNSNGTK